MSDNNEVPKKGVPAPGDVSHNASHTSPEHEPTAAHQPADVPSTVQNAEPQMTDDLLLEEYDIAGVALGVADDDEAARVEAAAAADPRVGQALAEMQDVVAQLSVLAPRHEINRGRSAGIRSRLVSKAAASREGRTSAPRKTAELLQPWFKRPGTAGTGEAAPRGVSSTGASSPISAGSGRAHATPRPVAPQPAPQYRRSGPIAVGPWVALAAAVAILIGGVQQWRLVHAQQELRTAVASRENSMTGQIAQLRDSVQRKDSIIQSLTGPNMKVVDLVNYSSQDPLARMFWNQKTQEWTMYAYHMRQPKPGKTFQVWLIASNDPKPISAGTFQPNAQGEAVLRAHYPLDRHALVKVAVSEEPAGGMPYPTGPIVIAGR